MSSLLWRVNPVTIISAAIAMAGLFLPWWGIDVTGTNIDRVRIHWNIWNPPRLARLSGAPTLYCNIALSSTTVLALALVGASLVVVGSLTLMRKYLIAGLGLSTASLAIYTIVVNYVTANYCLVATICGTGPVGTAPFPGIASLRVDWGFQSGFYITLLAVLLLAAGLLLNNLLVQHNPTRRYYSPQVSATSKTDPARSAEQT